MTEKVLIFGASNKTDRYSYKAMQMLNDKGHQPILVHPKLSEIEATKVFNSLEEAASKYPQIDTITLYVNPQISSSVIQQILAIKPKRVIFNPGTENPELKAQLDEAGIDNLDACTLVMLSTGQF